VNPQFPLYICSKGRFKRRLTSDFLSYCKIPHFIVVEPSEVADYKNATKDDPLVTILELDMGYKENYDTLDDLGDQRSKGAGAARNFAWDHAIKNGAPWYWIMDDNIRNFLRANNNRQIRVSDGAIFKAMEDFCLRYKNLYMAGPNYFMFFPRKAKVKPVVFNTRIYSCNLIKTSIPFRWRGRHNEDTIISLDVLSNGFCTAQFNAFLQNKMATETMAGGNTSDIYAKQGRYDVTKMLINVYPKYSRMMERFGRVHHFVDYSSFRKNKLIKTDDMVVKKGVNDYGMTIKKISG
jgi:hypothetical protein